MSVFVKGFGEHDGLSAEPLRLSIRKEAIGFLFFTGVELSNVGDHASEAGMGAVFEFFNLIKVGKSAMFERPLVAGERVS